MRQRQDCGLPPLHCVVTLCVCVCVLPWLLCLCACVSCRDADSELQKRLEEKPDRSWEHVLSLVDVSCVALRRSDGATPCTADAHTRFLCPPVSGSPADKVQRDVSRMRKLLLKLREAEQKNGAGTSRSSSSSGGVYPWLLPVR